MGNLTSKDDRGAIPEKETPAFYMYTHYRPKCCRFLVDWNRLTRGRGRSLWFPREGSFDLSKIMHLKEVLESRGSKVGRDEWKAFIDWHTEASKRHQDAQEQRHRDSIVKLEDKIRAFESLNHPPPPQQVPGGVGEPVRAQEVPQPPAPAAAPPAPAQAPAQAPAAACSVPLTPPPSLTPTPLVASDDRASWICSPRPRVVEYPEWRRNPGDGTTFRPKDLYDLAYKFSDIEKEPKEFKNQLSFVINVFKPTWADMNRLLTIALPTEVRERLFDMALWPLEDPGEGPYLVWVWQALLNAVVLVCPRKSDWGKIVSCKQEMDEQPIMYLDRFTKVFEEHSGIDDPDNGATQGMAIAFVQGLLPRVQKQLRTFCVGWEGKHMYELAAIAHYYWQLEQERKMIVRRGPKRRRPKKSFDPSACFYCRQVGHWIKECPYRLRRQLQLGQLAASFTFS
ncbi:uncharacterized protein LOC110205767 [Phascolarctos cinereus]|uniref:Uncharacterized protein LOC110205767 n=1 Tax=Phascolarctos cinereus TaxID=38626 RepID=A0A6P5JZH9_PHACI|nr:uncharacterized protein LOC110205767 [Phascolarctos cinereus]XP_020838224.1 uncharacterized protein LOC110205767 [Phascolarctos cinereus]XP_020838225.1 uncharacterized protein LOC110205767 [Phascolarctos cinereus]XP_020838226.1 uncharacterized protein LOC110205767 [Phascolarctos cinereus]